MKKVLFIFVCLFVGLNFVYADDVVGETFAPTGYSVDVDAQTGAVAASLKLTLNHPTEADGTAYYLYFIKNQNDAAPDLTANTTVAGGNLCSIKSGILSSKVGTFNLTDSSSNKINVEDEWYLLDGYEYAYVIKLLPTGENSRKCMISSSPINVERPDLPTISGRYKIYIFGDSDNAVGYPNLSAFPLFPKSFGANANMLLGEEKTITKVGLVEDNNILLKFKNGESDAYSSLLSYAKAATNGRSYVGETGSAYTVDLRDLSISNGSYYYIYTTYTDSGTIYRNLDGISLVMGKNNILVNDVTFDGINGGGDLPSGSIPPATENPKTGTLPVIFIICAAIGLFMIGFYAVGMKKNTEE